MTGVQAAALVHRWRTLGYDVRPEPSVMGWTVLCVAPDGETRHAWGERDIQRLLAMGALARLDLDVGGAA